VLWCRVRKITYEAGKLAMEKHDLHRILDKEIRGEVLFDKFSRGRYATDASMYQMMPAGVVIPADINDVKICLQAASAHKCSIVARGGGTSQCGQTVNTGMVCRKPPLCGRARNSSG